MSRIWLLPRDSMLPGPIETGRSSIEPWTSDQMVSLSVPPDKHSIFHASLGELDSLRRPHLQNLPLHTSVCFNLQYSQSNPSPWLHSYQLFESPIRRNMLRAGRTFSLLKIKKKIVLSLQQHITNGTAWSLQGSYIEPTCACPARTKWWDLGES